MASQKPPQRFDALEAAVNDVVVQTAKAIRSSRADGPRAVPAVSHGHRIQQLHSNFNSALDDMESELMKAKAILQRDLDLMRAKRRLAVVPEPVMLSQPVAVSGPEVTASAVPPPAAVVPTAPASQPQPQLKQPPTPNMNPGGAPFPNMGVGQASQASPVNIKAESPPKQPPAALNVSGRSPQKGASPMVKTASAPGAKPATLKKESPGVKSATLATVKAGSPALKTASPGPPLKKASPIPASVKPVPKATPPPVTASVPPPPVANKAAASPVVAIPPPKPQPVAPPPPPADPLDGILDLTNPTTFQNGGGAIGSGATASAGTGPQLNFTNMQFSLAPPPSATTEPPSSTGGENDFDLDSFITDATNNLLTDQFGGTGNGPGSATGPSPATGAADDPMDTSGGGDASAKVDVNVIDKEIADLLRFDGPTDLSSAGGDAAGSSSFDDMWIDGGSTNMGEFDSSYFDM